MATNLYKWFLKLFLYKVLIRRFCVDTVVSIVTIQKEDFRIESGLLLCAIHMVSLVFSHSSKHAAQVSGSKLGPVIEIKTCC